jgi:hypothetical protein
MSSTIHDLLSNVIGHDSIGVHDWGDPDTWQKKPEGGWSDPENMDSSFVVEPKPGEAIIIQEAAVKFAADAKMQSPMLIELYVGDICVKTRRYEGKKSFIDRFTSFKIIPLSGINGYTADVLLWEYEFDEKIQLWSSGGFTGGTPQIVDGKPVNMILDGDGNPKLTKMVLRIENDKPYYREDGTVPNLALVRYPSSIICKDPDVG